MDNSKIEILLPLQPSELGLAVCVSLFALCV